MSGHDGKFDGLFGEDGTPEAQPARRVPLAGIFGFRQMALRRGDRKSPAEQGAEAGKQKPDAR